MSAKAGTKRKAEDFSGQVVVFTGFRSTELEVALKAAGAAVTSSVSGKTTILVCQNLASATSNKAQEARARGVRIMTRDEMNAALGGVEGGAGAGAGGSAAVKKTAVAPVSASKKAGKAKKARGDDEEDEDGDDDDAPAPAPAKKPAAKAPPTSATPSSGAGATGAVDFAGQVVVFTGFRSVDLEGALKAAGAAVTSSVSGKTTILVAQDPASANGQKAQAARAKGIRIMTRAEVEAALNVASAPKAKGKGKKKRGGEDDDDDDEEDGAGDEDEGEDEDGDNEEEADDGDGKPFVLARSTEMEEEIFSIHEDRFFVDTAVGLNNGRFTKDLSNEAPVHSPEEIRLAKRLSRQLHKILMGDNEEGEQTDFAEAKICYEGILHRYACYADANKSRGIEDPKKGVTKELIISVMGSCLAYTDQLTIEKLDASWPQEEFISAAFMDELEMENESYSSIIKKLRKWLLAKHASGELAAPILYEVQVSDVGGAIPVLWVAQTKAGSLVGSVTTACLT